ncbi:MAG: carboxypeptidase regulatory-like domain-containing protein [Gemmatimonadota bacterium]
MGGLNGYPLRAWLLALSVSLAAVGCGGGGGGNGNGTGPQFGSVSGSVINETQANAGVPNVSVQLARSGAQNRNATTDVSGAFSFTNVEPGTAAVQISFPAGLELAANESGSRPITVAANQTVQVQPFRLRAPAPTTGTISGRVTSGTTGVANARVTGSGGLGASTTNATGDFSFTNVAPGVRTLTLAVPDGFSLSQGESAAKTATVVAGQTVTVNWSLQQSAVSTNAVDMRDDFFQPRDITVSVGATVTWTNRGISQHTVTSDTGIWDSGARNPGATFTRTFSQAGTFPYHCTLHGAPGAGMAGTVTVQ